MKQPYKILVPSEQIYEYEIWLIKNNYRNIKIQYLKKISIIFFYDEEEYLLFKLKDVPILPICIDKPDIRFINQIRKSMNLNSMFDILDLTVDLSR